MSRAKGSDCRRAGLIVAHSAVEGRLRFRHPKLGGNTGFGSEAVAQILRHPGIRSAVTNPLTGSVLVRYGAPATTASVKSAVADAIRDATSRAALARPHALSSAAPAMAAHESLGDAWHALSADEILGRLHGGRGGLSAEVARCKLAESGPNRIARAGPRSAAAIFADQLTSLPIALLSASAALSLASGGIADAVAITAAVLLNSGIATATEQRAERTILALSRYDAQPVPAMRDGIRVRIDPADLVPGDVILIDPGMLVPADARLIESAQLTVNESALTGESLPVDKNAAETLSPDAPLAERVTMLYRGTAVTGGRGTAVVVGTGKDTEIGRIQALLGTVRPPETPIQRQLGEVGRELVIVNGAICAAIFGLGVLRGQGPIPMLRSAISLAVAAIPEGLPAVATTTLAIGIRDLAKRNIFVRKLEAVETLGAVEVVGLDKTGTLTANRMATVAFHYDGALADFDGGRVHAEGERESIEADAVLRELLEAAVLSSEAAFVRGPDGTKLVGSPTEGAMVQAAIDIGIDVEALRRAYPLLTAVPRSESRKRVSTLLGDGAGRRVCVKGDPAEVLQLCTKHRTSAGVVTLDLSARDDILRANDRMAGRALRVLGVAACPEGDPENERDLVWLGLAGIADPLRPGVKEAIHKLHGAGIRTVMITGDQSSTASAIAHQLDLGNGGDIRILEAGKIRDVSPEILAALAPQAQVFARISPANKLQIVRALQTRGHIVAMTGDGINDGPALRAADIGIAMGAAGTDVAREVADIVLGADDLDGIVEAVRLGRSTYANIRKVLRYLIGTNASETMVMLGAALAGWQAPLTPMQLLWLNLISDVMPGLALGLDPPEPDVLDYPPHDPTAPILSVQDFRRLLREGAVLGVGGFAAFLMGGGAARGANANGASTLAFHSITLAQLIHAFACRSETHGLLEEFRRPPNPKVFGAVGVGLALQIAAQTIPPLRRMLQLAPIGPGGLAAILAGAFGPLVANEILSAALRRDDGLPEL